MAIKKQDPKFKQIVKELGDPDPKIRAKAAEIFAQAVREPIREAVFDCDIVSNIFVAEEWDAMCPVTYQLDIIQPGKEKEYTAFAIPKCSSMPRYFVESDYITLPTYRIGNQMEWCDDHARTAHYNLFNQAVRYFRSGFVKKINDDAWRLLIAAGLDRNMVVYDDQSSPGQFTKRLLSLMKLAMARNNGGNNQSCSDAHRLTDMYISLESHEDILDWGDDQVSDITRAKIFETVDGLNNIFGVNLHPLSELGVGQEYQLLYENELGGVLPGPSNTGVANGGVGDPLPEAKREIVVGLSLTRREDVFVMPVREEMRMTQYQCIPEGMSGILGSSEIGLAVLDGRAVILGAL